MSIDKRYIEETFPVKEVGNESAREKSIRHGHPSTLHIWWARRPLASSRTTCYAALIPPPTSKDVEMKRKFIIDFSMWKNTNNERMIETARKEILRNNGGKPPKVLDPFAGGGTIPLEALRLGCESYSSDLNPVAVLIQKCTIEYPQKYRYSKDGDTPGKSFLSTTNPLLEDVRKWSIWVLERSKAEISKFYPDDSMIEKPIGYIWARTIPCQNPSCQKTIPLMRQFWLSRRSGKIAALFPFIKDGNLQFKIVGDGYEKMSKEFDPLKGTVKGAIITCPVCRTMIDADTTRKLFRKGQSNQKMIAVITVKEGTQGKFYRISTNEDISTYATAIGLLTKKREKLAKQWDIDPVPTELIHTPDGREYNYGQPLYNFLPILLYGMKTWEDLFNDRQKLSIVTFIEGVRAAYREMINEGENPEYAKAVTSYLALIVDRLADKNASLVFYNAHRETIEHVFGRQALSMVWDYVELNPFASVGWPNMSDWVYRNIEQLALSSSKPGIVLQANATSLKFADGMFDAVFTDPPYYDNVPYAVLSDFFYVWLKRSIGYLYPELFSTPFAPKSTEIIADLPLLRGMNKEEAVKKIPGIKTKADFEDRLRLAFREIYRVLKPKGIAVIVYAHKSTEGWETLVNSLIDSGLVITGAWPINTEKPGRLRAHESAALASSIYIITRKIKRESTAIYRDVKQEIEVHLEKKLQRLWKEGIGGADFFIAAIGSAIEIFGKYETIIDFEGTIIRADTLLEDVRNLATNFAIQQILHNGFSETISPLTRFYILYRWNFNTSQVNFDDARKLAQSCGIDLANQWGESAFIRKRKEFIEVVGPKERKIEDLKDSTELIDILHHIVLLWEKGRKDKISKILAEKKLENSEVFWRIAQAISETLPTQNKEKKLLDGLLVGRTGYQSEDRYEQETLE